MTDDFLEKEREMEASDTEKEDLAEERRTLIQEHGLPEDRIDDLRDLQDHNWPKI